jgi:hypothetical protein
MWEEEGDNWGRKDDKKGKVRNKYDQSTLYTHVKVTWSNPIKMFKTINATSWVVSQIEEF